MKAIDYVNNLYDMALIASKELQLLEGEIAVIPCAYGGIIRKEYNLTSHDFDEICRIVKSNDSGFDVGIHIATRGRQTRYKTLYGINFYIYTRDNLGEKLKLKKAYKVKPTDKLGIESFRILAGDDGCQMNLKSIDYLWELLEELKDGMVKDKE